MENPKEPRCRIYTHLAPSTASDPRILEDCYKSFIARRRECCDPQTCNAKIGTGLRSELDSRARNVDRLVDKIQELKRNVQHLNESNRHNKAGINEQKRAFEQSEDDKIIDLKGASDALENCSREIAKIKTFLEDENAWWKILKDRPVDCCKQKLPHLHGVLDGSLVTLTLLEEGSDEAPRCFATSTPKRGSDAVNRDFRNPSRELANETRHTERSEPCNECRQSYINSHASPSYGFDIKSMIEVEKEPFLSAERHEQSQRYAKTTARSKQTTVESEVWSEMQNDRSGEQVAPDWSSRLRGTRDRTQHERKEDRANRSKIASPRDTSYGHSSQTMRGGTLRPRETFSSENTGSMKQLTVDFESNVDLNSELPSRNTAGHRSRTREIAEKAIRHILKCPVKVSQIGDRD